jgi:hypothetical protein
MAAPLEPNATSIEALFRPTTRFRDSPSNRYLPEGWTELKLLPGLTIENVWATGVTWEEFRLFLQNKIVWMTTNVYVCSRHFNGDDPWVLGLGFGVGTSLYVRVRSGMFGVGTSLYVRVRSGMAAAAATATCNCILCLLATSEHHGVYILGRDSRDPPPLSGAALPLFFQESQNCLHQVVFHNMAFSADQCRALATMSRLDMELEISFCRVLNDAAGAFVECLHTGRGPVKLDQCMLDNQILVSALIGKSRVTKLKPVFGQTNHAETAILFRALANNRS